MEDLYDTFGSFGPLASARILYPRPNESRPYMFAFVAYMSRRDAERAQMAMNGAELNGSDIKVMWAKVVEIPEVVHIHFTLMFLINIYCQCLAILCT